MNTRHYLFTLCVVSFLYAAETPNMIVQVYAAKGAALATTRLIRDIPLSTLAAAQNNPSNPATNIQTTLHEWEILHHQLVYNTHLFHHGLPNH